MQSTDILHLVGSISSVAGLGSTFVKWFRAKKKAKSKATVEDYLEWLRRKNHKKILATLNKSDETILELKKLLEQLLHDSHVQVEAILLRLDVVESRIISRIDQLEEYANLYPPDNSLTRREQRFEKTYLKQVKKHHSEIQMLGIREMRGVRQQLKIAYVTLNLSGSENTDTEPADILVARCPRLIIRGSAGSGKTTLLNWIATQTTDPSNKQWNGGVPFFIRLRRLNAENGFELKMEDFVDHTIDRRLWFDEPPKNWLQKVLDEKRAILLIDGVDELSPSARPGFWDWLNQFSKQYESVRIYVTSRVFPHSQINGAISLLKNEAFQS